MMVLNIATKWNIEYVIVFTQILDSLEILFRNQSDIFSIDLK
jgi:hypothetical protein